MGTFALDLSRLVDKAKGQTELAVRKVMLEAFQKVVKKSPVDTGRFRANWVVGYASPNLSISDRTDKSGGGTVSEIAAKVQSLKVLDGVSIFLTNSLPYAIKLENGYSRQAPVGMVKTTLAEIVARYGA